jgi:hypothetical protein
LINVGRDIETVEILLWKNGFVSILWSRNYNYSMVIYIWFARFINFNGIWLTLEQIKIEEESFNNFNGPVVRVWDQKVCSPYDFRFESCSC